MNATDAFANSLALLYFLGTTWTGVAENTDTSPLTEWEQSLHTADPGASGNQTTSEVGYTSYARAGVARSGAGYDVAANVITLDAPVEFPQGTGGSGTATHFGHGTASAGAGILHFRGAITPNIVCGDGITPVIDITVTIPVAA